MAKSAHPVRHRLEYVVFRLIAAFIASLPLRTAVGICDLLALLFARVLPQKLVRGHVGRENIRNAFPEASPERVEEILTGMWRHLFRLIVEVVLLPRKAHRATMDELLDCRNRDAATRTMCAGRPVLLLGGHFGNWEVGTIAFGMFGFPVNVVARDLDNPYLHNWFEGLRRSWGGRLISKRGGGDEITSVLTAGGIVGLLCDQDAGNRGVFVPFFGQNASTFKSIALLALEFGAPMIVGYTVRLPDDSSAPWVRFEVGCEAILDPDDFAGSNAIEQMTVAYTSALEQAIRRHPEQYFWVHRRWKSQPRVREKRVRQAA